MNLSPFSFVRKSIGCLCQAAEQRLRQWTMPDSHGPVLSAALDLTRSKQELILENMLLRQPEWPKNCGRQPHSARAHAFSFATTTTGSAMYLTESLTGPISRSYPHLKWVKLSLPFPLKEHPKGIFGLND